MLREGSDGFRDESELVEVEEYPRFLLADQPNPYDKVE